MTWVSSYGPFAGQARSHEFSAGMKVALYL